MLNDLWAGRRDRINNIEWNTEQYEIMLFGLILTYATNIRCVAGWVITLYNSRALSWSFADYMIEDKASIVLLVNISEIYDIPAYIKKSNVIMENTFFFFLKEFTSCLSATLIGFTILF